MYIMSGRGPTFESKTAGRRPRRATGGVDGSVSLSSEQLWMLPELARRNTSNKNRINCSFQPVQAGSSTCVCMFGCMYVCMPACVRLPDILLEGMTG